MTCSTRLPIPFCSDSDAADDLSFPAVLGCQDGRSGSTVDCISHRHSYSPLLSGHWAKKGLARAPLPTPYKGVTRGMFACTHRADQTSGNPLPRVPRCHVATGPLCPRGREIGTSCRSNCVAVFSQCMPRKVAHDPSSSAYRVPLRSYRGQVDSLCGFEKLIVQSARRGSLTEPVMAEHVHRLLTAKATLVRVRHLHSVYSL
jgi:hypothetical protein